MQFFQNVKIPIFCQILPQRNENWPFFIDWPRPVGNIIALRAACLLYFFVNSTGLNCHATADAGPKGPLFGNENLFILLGDNFFFFCISVTYVLVSKS